MAESFDPSPEQQLSALLDAATQSLRNGRAADAIAPLREAAQLAPSHAALQHDLGLACLEVGRIPEAISSLQQAIRSAPGYADAHFRLGIALEKSGNLHEAIAAYDRATRLLPSLTEAWFRAGALAYSLGYREQAVGCFQRASETGGKTSFGRLAKARMLLTQDRSKEAEQVLLATIAREPQNAIAHDLLGNLLTELGRFDQARQCFQQVVGISPLLSGSYYELVRCRPVTADDRLLDEMKAALEVSGLDPGERVRLHLAIAKAADDLGDYALAMQHCDAADAVRRTSLPFDADAFAIEVDRMIARYTDEWIARSAARGNPDQTPVLILGMPRSGTTLVEQIISNHPGAGAAGELHFWNQRGAQWYSSTQSEAPLLTQSATDYLALLHALAPRKLRVTDKMPFNFLWAGLIHAALPRATIVHCRRSPIDTALSIHQTHFNPALRFPTGGTELVKYFRSYLQLMEHWRRVLPSDRFLEVDYEELTRAPEPEIRRLIAGCGLAWNDACLHPETNSRAVRTPSRWQARQPINRNSVARWQRYEPWLGPLRALLE